MTEQELQMIQLMSGARGGNKNLGGVLNNMDNELLAIMAGVFDPRTSQQSGGGGNGPYWSRYSQSENPIIQDVISKITSGADKFQINSYIDSIAAPGVDLGGFQVSDLKGVAGELYKEYTGTSTGSSGSKNKSDTQKAGIPDPSELYDTSTVPLATANELYIKKLQDDLAPKIKGYGDAEYQAKVARLNMARYSESETKNNSKNDFGGPYVITGKGFVQPGKGYKQTVKNDFGGPYVIPGKGYTSDGKKFSDKTSKDVKPYDKNAAKAYDDAMIKVKMMETLASAANQREQAVRDGQMDYARQSGATPTTDALKTILKFISSSK